MFKDQQPLAVAFLSISFLGGCASQIYHDYIMSGQIVTVDDKQVVVCVSDTDSIKEHQVFNVYRTVNFVLIAISLLVYIKAFG